MKPDNLSAFEHIEEIRITAEAEYLADKIEDAFIREHKTIDICVRSAEMILASCLYNYINSLPDNTDLEDIVEGALHNVRYELGQIIKRNST